METFSIETNAGGGFEVRATDRDGKTRIVDHFPSYQAAQEWIDRQTEIAMKSANASDVA